MLNVVLDTNFMVHALDFGVDFFSEFQRLMDVNYRVSVLDKSIDELEKLINEGKFSERKASKLALGLIKTKDIKIISTHGKKPVDDLLVSLDPKDNVVATQDRELKSRLKKKGFRVLTMRQKKYIKWEN